MKIQATSATKMLGMILGFVFLPGCALLSDLSGTSTTEANIPPRREVHIPSYKDQMAEWVGKDVNGLLLTWGPPSSTFAMPNGDIMYTWLIEDNKLVSQHGSDSDHFSGTSISNGWSVTHDVKNSCRTSFTAAKNTITAFSFQGNMCVVSVPPEDPIDPFTDIKIGDTVHLLLDGGREVTDVFNGASSGWVSLGKDFGAESIPLKAVRNVKKISS